MAKLYGEIAAKALLTLDKSFARANGQPLDASEVYYSLQAAKDYAATAQAYIGQKIVVVEDNVVTHYSVEDTAGNLKELGSKPVGDEKSITVAEDGTVSLAGIGTLVFEREEDVLGEDGQPTGEKKTVEVKYQPLMTKAGLVWVEPSKTTVEGLATLIDELTQRVSALEQDVEDLKEKEDKDTTYSVKEGEKVLSLEGTEFSTTLKLVYADNKIKLLGINDEEVSSFDASAFVTDGVLENAEYDADTKELVFTWNIVTGEDEEGNPIYKTDKVNIGDLVDTYTAGNGLNLKDNQFSVKVLETDKYLTVDATGVHTKDIDSAITTAKEAAIADADGKLALKANAADVYAKTETYSQSEIDDLLEGIQAGSSESAASVATKLDNFKKATNLELYGNEEGTGDSRIDALEAVGAQANVIEEVKHSATAKITAIKEGKTVTIDDAALVTDITAAKNAADAANAKATANTTTIGGMETRLQAAETKINDNTAAISAHATEFATLKGRVDAHDTTLLDKANKTDVYTKEQVNAITGTLVEGKTLVGMIGEKANASDVYTKDNVYTKSETNAEIKKVTDTIGTVTEGKTLVEMIADAKSEATYDDTEVKASIDAIYKAGEGEAAATGVLADEIARATAAEAANAKSIADLTAAIDNVSNIMNFRGVVEATEAGFEEDIKVIAEPKDGDVILYKEQEYVYNNGAWILFGDATGNAAAITALTARVEANETAVTTTLPGLITKTLTDAKVYTDEQITALEMANYTVKSVVSGHEALIVNNVDGVVTIGFADEIVLNGGKAN